MISSDAPQVQYDNIVPSAIENDYVGENQYSTLLPHKVGHGGLYIY